MLQPKDKLITRMSIYKTLLNCTSCVFDEERANELSAQRTEEWCKEYEEEITYSVDPFANNTSLPPRPMVKPEIKTQGKSEPQVGDHFIGNDGQERYYRQCSKCGQAKWFKGAYKTCYDCNQK